MKIKNEKGITLIALIITIILMLILAGVVISLTLGENGLFTTAKYAVTKTEEETAREKLEVALADLQARKYTDATYNENEYIDNYLIKEEIPVSKNIASVDGWKFELDRTVPKIGQNLGKGKLESIAIITPYIGTTSFTTKTSYVYNEEELESYTYKIDGVGIKTITEKEYTTENELEAESTHTVQVIAKYKNGKTIESNIVTIKTEPRTYLYNNGDTCDTITGGWKSEAVGNEDEFGAVLVKPILNTKVDSNHMNAYVSGTSYVVGGRIMPVNKIDYSEYKKVGITYTANLGYYNGADEVRIGIADIQGNRKTIRNLCYANPITTKTTIKSDIPNMENIDNINIYLQEGGNSLKTNIDIYEIWLEK